MDTAKVLTAPPSVFDRCDTSVCDAQALVRVELKGGELVFCGHHFDKVKPDLHSVMLGVCDTRLELDVQPGLPAV